MATNTLLIKQRLIQDPERSNRSISADLGVNDKLVGEVRRELESESRIPIVTHTRGIDGRLRLRRIKPQENDKTRSILPFLNSYNPARKQQINRSDSILGQIRTAFTSHPLAFIVALPFGGFVPLAVWVLAHLEPIHWWHWVMIGGGALFSSLTVITWGQRILSNLPKAVGFALLVEGVMLASQTMWLSISALGLLVIINAIACAVSLSYEEQTS
jgi:hypothetical protein